MVNANDYNWIKGNRKYLIMYRQYLLTGNIELRNQIIKKCNYDLLKTIYALMMIGMFVKGKSPQKDGLKLLFKFKDRANRKNVDLFFDGNDNLKFNLSFYSRGLYLCGLITLFDLEYKVISLE